jgi:hypothetical protein
MLASAAPWGLRLVLAAAGDKLYAPRLWRGQEACARRREKLDWGGRHVGSYTGGASWQRLMVAGTAAAAYAEIAISANDGKVKLVNGKVEVQKSPPADTATFIDLRASPPKVLAEIDVPGSVVGPPTSVAISPKEDIALVTSAMQIDPADPTKQVPDDKVSVIDLSPLKPGLVSRLRTAVGAAPKGAAPAPKIIATLAGRQGCCRRIVQQGRNPGAGGQPGRGHGFRIHGQRHDGHGCRQSDGRQAGLWPQPRRVRARRQECLRQPRQRPRVVVLSVDGTKVESTKARNRGGPASLWARHSGQGGGCGCRQYRHRAVATPTRSA